MTALPGNRPAVLLELDLTTMPVLADGDDPLARLRARGRRQLRPTLLALHEAGEDRHVVGLVARVGGLPWAGMQEIRRGVEAFTRSGKPTVAWAESLGEGPSSLSALALASVFDEFWLQPGGSVGPLGVGIETTFLRGMLDRLGIEPQLEQRHEYKNAADHLLRTEFTPAHREAMERLAESVFDEAVEAVAAGRHLSEDRVRGLVDVGLLTAAEARDGGLVDRLGFRDQVYASVRQRVSADAQLVYADRWRPPRRPRLPRPRRGHVALVDARGTITSGRSRRTALGRQLGSDSIGAQLRAVLDNDRAMALVLRIDSPGGSAVASETIWREICRVREKGIPVVVSMGDVAGSGGYFIACPADVIVALPTTLTGSIGVFGGKLVVRELLERVGLSTGTVEQGARSLMDSARRGYDGDERARLAAIIDVVYEDFVAKVAAGRQRPAAEVEQVARGRVWTGRDAADNGLVDQLGGLRDAVRIARERAGLSDDAPVLPALHLSPLARLGTAKNSEDPRALAGGVWPDLDDLATALGVPLDTALLMPSIKIS